MKRWLLTILIVLMLVPTSYAAGEDGVRVAIIDTGISTVAVDPARIDSGINYIRPQDDLEDKLGHGTAVSAIIVGSEAARIEGICPTATLVPMVFATKDEDGKQVRGDTAMVAQAIYDAIDIYHCDIINISSGSTGGSQRLKEAVEYAEKKGVLVISCAGNDQEDHPGAVCYPGGYDSVICVGAANSDGSIAAFSQQNDTVDLLALGTDLRLASVKGTRIRGEGTSFATAIVTGAAARIWTENPELTASEVRMRLRGATRLVGDWRVLDLEAVTRGEKLSAFADVTVDSFCYDAVLWAMEKGVTQGVTKTAFAPRQTCSQAHILTFLWRALGEPLGGSGSAFANAAVREGQYFYDAFCWAWRAGLITDPAIDPHTPCSRSDVVTYLWKLAGSPKSSSAAFADVLADADYAQAVSWAVSQGITQGVTTTQFLPTAACNRGQIVTFLYRAYG